MSERTAPITSPDNGRLKLVRKLATSKGRRTEGAFAIEGEDLLDAALQLGWRPRFVLISAERPLAPMSAPLGVDLEVLLTDDRLLGSAAQLGSPPRVIAVFDLPGEERAQSPASGHGATVLLDGMRDPGNVGSMLRSAAAFGVRSVGIGMESADPYSPKATRASMGAIFRVRSFPAPDVAALAVDGRQVVAFDAHGSVELSRLEFSADPVICIGAEREGLSDAVREAATVIARIPQRPEVDSLGAASVTAIALYEWRRQHPDLG